MPGDALYHLALAGDWRAARDTGSYTASTIGRTLEEEGFVHCSHASQVRAVADLFYRHRDDVILLRIDPAAVGSEVKLEAVGPGQEEFPHVYGPIPVAAVIRAHPLETDAAGRLVLPESLDDI